MDSPGAPRRLDGAAARQWVHVYEGAMSRGLPVEEAKRQADEVAAARRPATHADPRKTGAA